MPNLTDLTFTVNSAFSGLGSLNLYCVWDDDDFKITPEDMQKVIGRRGGAGVFTVAVQSVATATNHRVTWGSIMYEEGAGWVDFAVNSQRLTAPRPGVYQAFLGLTWTIVGDFEARGTILQMNSFNNNLPWPSRRYMQAGSERKNVWMPPTTMASGDFITAVVKQDSGANKNLDPNCFFSIWPLFYT